MRVLLTRRCKASGRITNTIGAVRSTIDGGSRGDHLECPLQCRSFGPARYACRCGPRLFRRLRIKDDGGLVAHFGYWVHDLANIAGGRRQCLSQLPMTSTAGAFVSNAASRAPTRAAFAQNATIGTVSAVTGCFAPAQAVACRFSHHEAARSIAHRLADCAGATLLSLPKKVRDSWFGRAVRASGHINISSTVNMC
jgi:hypothetical protein